MIKGKIAAGKSFGSSIFVRIKNDGKSKKRFMQFRQKLNDQLRAKGEGREGFIKISGPGVDINVVNSEKYFYFIFYGKKRKDAYKIFTENFEF